MQYGRELKFVAGGIKLVAITGSDANEAALTIGALYRMSYSSTSAASALPGAVVVRFGSSAATAADGGGDFCINAGESIIVRATSATIHAIGIGGAGATGSLYCAKIDEGV